MRSFQPMAVVALLILALGACSGIEVRPEGVEKFTAGNYQYYTWRSQPLQNTADSKDPMYALDPIFRRQLNSALQAKGYQLNDELAQFSVDYLYAESLRQGEVSREASNLSTYPGVIPNRDLDQASIDNAYAMGGMQETRNIGVQFNDVKRQNEVWRVIITKIVENVNTVDTADMEKNLNKALKQALRTLPDAQ